jgi:hypothetical protein
MAGNILQLIQDSLQHIYVLRQDKNATREDVIADLEQRFVQLMHHIVATPTVDNFLLPIDNFDQNDVFLNKDSTVSNGS